MDFNPYKATKAELVSYLTPILLGVNLKKYSKSRLIGMVAQNNYWDSMMQRYKEGGE